MSINKLCLWEILVPTVRNDGRPISTKFHRLFDEKVQNICGGLSVFPPIKGTWTHQETDEVFKERMIPVRIACSKEQIEEIADFSAKHYEQLAIMYYLVSEQVFIKNYVKIEPLYTIHRERYRSDRDRFIGYRYYAGEFTFLVSNNDYCLEDVEVTDNKILDHFAEKLKINKNLLEFADYLQ